MENDHKTVLFPCWLHLICSFLKAGLDQNLITKDFVWCSWNHTMLLYTTYLSLNFPCLPPKGSVIQSNLVDIAVLWVLWFFLQQSYSILAFFPCAILNKFRPLKTFDNYSWSNKFPLGIKTPIHICSKFLLAPL